LIFLPLKYEEIQVAGNLLLNDKGIQAKYFSV